MEPLFFGRSDQPVLGVYHAADFSRDRGEGVVLCYPFGQEYMRAHRAYRQLASGLSRLGYHVLRFDYRGTGDSYGDLESVTYAMWLEDVDAAIEELTDICGCRKVTMLGLRLGALVARQAAYRNSRVNRLVLWDPSTSGDAFVNEIRSEIEAAGKSNSRFVDSDGTMHFNGFALSSGFQSELMKQGFDSEIDKSVETLLIVSHETPAFSALNKELSDQGHRLKYIYEVAPHNWNYVDNVGGILLPSKLLNRLLEWFK